MSATTPAQKALRSTSVRRPLEVSISLKKRFAACSITVAVLASTSSCRVFSTSASSRCLTSGIARKRSRDALVRFRPPKVKRRLRSSPARALVSEFVAAGSGSTAANASLACFDLSCASSVATLASASRSSRPRRTRAVSVRGRLGSVAGGAAVRAGESPRAATAARATLAAVRSVRSKRTSSTALWKPKSRPSSSYCCKRRSSQRSRSASSSMMRSSSQVAIPANRGRHRPPLMRTCPPRT